MSENIINLPDGTFEIRFDYPTKTIRAKTLAEYIKNLNLVIQDISLSQGNMCEIIIEATPEGSFKLKAFMQKIAKSDIGQTLKYMVDTEEKRFLITKTLMLLGGLGSFYIALETLKKDDTHQKEEKDNQIMITDSINQQVIVSKKIYDLSVSYPNIKTNIAKMCYPISSEPNLEKVEIHYNDMDRIHQEITWDKEKIAILSKIKNQSLNLKPDNYIHLPKQSIRAIKVDFEGNSKWTMVLDGEKHSVNIESETLQLMQKEHISNRDKFIVDITITQKYDEQYDDYINDKYAITYLHQHMPFEDNILPLSYDK